MPKLLSEKLITFTELARRLPRRRRGRPVHVSTIFRWRSPGVRGVKLEATRVGGSWATSWPAFERFCDRLTAEQTKDEVVCLPLTSGASTNDDAELEKEGLL